MIHEFDMICQGNTSFGFEMSSLKLDGSLITGILHIFIPASNSQPDYTRVIVTSTDITERVEIEKRLRASELHYRELADSITDVLFELDHDLRYTHWNKATEMLMGIPARDAIGKSMFEIFGASEEQVRIGGIYQSVLEEGQAKTFETEIFILAQKLFFEINANPSTNGFSVVARNITERKLSETLMQKRFALVEYSAHHSFEETETPASPSPAPRKVSTAPPPISPVGSRGGVTRNPENMTLKEFEEWRLKQGAKRY